MSDQRARIAKYVSATPGVHFSALVRELDLAPGQVQYHLRTLRRKQAVAEEHLYGKTHYYPLAYDDRERRVLALLRRETARDVLASFLKHGSARPAAVAEDLDIARSTLEWQLDRLVEQNVVEKRYDSQGRVRLELANRSETARLMGDVVPSLPARMADRFVRLTDRLLDDAAGTDPTNE
jgi:predicted transcriptional regulator